MATTATAGKVRCDSAFFDDIYRKALSKIRIIYMALLQDLICKIEDPALRGQIAAEVNKLSKQKKFGLVFEEHLPECTPLYDVSVKTGSKVALKTGEVSDLYIVRSIDGDKAICEHKTDHAEVKFSLDELVAVAEFGEPIYPYLKQIDSIQNTSPPIS